MTFFNRNVQQLVQDHSFFRPEVLPSQLVVMSVEMGDDIGKEVDGVDPVLVCVSGQGEAVLDGERSPVGPKSLVVVPARPTHHFVTTGQEPMKFLTVDAPPEEEAGTLHRTRAEAAEAQE